MATSGLAPRDPPRVLFRPIYRLPVPKHGRSWLRATISRPFPIEWNQQTPADPSDRWLVDHEPPASVKKINKNKKPAWRSSVRASLDRKLTWNLAVSCRLIIGLVVTSWIPPVGEHLGVFGFVFVLLGVRMGEDGGRGGGGRREKKKISRVFRVC